MSGVFDAVDAHERDRPAAPRRQRRARRHRSPTSSGSAPAGRPNGWCGRTTSTTSPASCASSIRRCRCLPVGVGSNLIVRDGGVPGVVVRLPKAMRHVHVEPGNRVRAGGGAMGITVASKARDADIAGLEFLRGIPGTAGGAVRMNAGAYGREVADILVEATLVLRDGRVETWPARAARLHLPPQRGARGRGRGRGPVRGRAGRARRDRRRDGPDRRRARGEPAAAQPHRRLDLQEPARDQGLEADRRRRLPRPHASATRRSRRSIATSCSTSASASAADIEALGEEVRRRVLADSGRRAGMGNPAGGEWQRGRKLPCRGADGRLVGRARGVADERATASPTRWRAAAIGSPGSTWTATSPRGLREAAPDVVFNALHGTPGEDGTVQGLMDLMGLRYTHSGLETSVIAIDKELTKMVLVPHGIRMPAGTIVESESLYAGRSAAAALCAEAGQRGLVGRRRDRHRRAAITATRSARDAEGPVAAISSGCSPSPSSAAAS